MTDVALLLRETGSPWVDYHQFMLFDVESTEAGPANLAQARDGAIAVSGHGGGMFFTLGEMTDVVVDFELWTAEPAPPTSPFEDRFDGAFTVDTGRVVLGSVTGSPADVVIDLPVSGPFQLRAFRSSTPTAHADFPDLDYRHERWLLQAWPSSAQTSPT
ncbi:hypothetical protein ACFORH_11190 [Amycolatopsis roodepoortensis]|uniref:Htaa domain-containing protein n=1 Tax=Amycolatopsis roodepoortensis TaxID=700274 RepID=A0ABR9LBS9_9PSEU|nr:hypothetical protein [Amycolatopsis roodepoortensis]MBE1577750.1 hypothetical protein [Amycolatopsis roodepoortensis]